MSLPGRLTASVAALALCGCGPATSGPQSASDPDGTTIVLATTTSTQDSGLLDELVPWFTAETGIDVQTIAVGSGQAIELARRGEVDVALVHSPDAEEELVAEGDTGRRLMVMHNDFVLLGPPSDPAGVAGSPVKAALAEVAATQAPFVSRGDESGTHAKELALWADAGTQPGGEWYTSTGQGMGATLRIASEKAGYTLADRATYLSQRDTLALDVVAEGDPGLLNVYHVIEMTTAAGERVEQEAAEAFTDWIVSDPVQSRIGEFGVSDVGERLFVPDAGRAEADLTG